MRKIIQRNNQKQEKNYPKNRKHDPSHRKTAKNQSADTPTRKDNAQITRKAQTIPRYLAKSSTRAIVKNDSVKRGKN